MSASPSGRIRIPDSGFRIPLESRIRNPDSGFLIPDSGFRIEISDSGFRIPDSGFQIEFADSGFRIPVRDCGFRIPDSGFRIPDPGFRNPIVLDSGLWILSGFRIPPRTLWCAASFLLGGAASAS